MVESNALSALLALLDPDPVKAADAYRRLHLRLIRFFNLTAASDPQQLADETIKRLAQRAAEDLAAVPDDKADDPAIGEVQPPVVRSQAVLASGVVREVLQEDRSRSRPSDQEVREWFAKTTNARDLNQERRQTILRSCLSKLPPERRRLLEKYYGWNVGHKADYHQNLARSLELNTVALHNRALRSRAQLEACVRGKQRDIPRHSQAKGRTQ